MDGCSKLWQLSPSVSRSVSKTFITCTAVKHKAHVWGMDSHLVTADTQLCWICRPWSCFWDFLWSFSRSCVHLPLLDSKHFIGWGLLPTGPARVSWAVSLPVGCYSPLPPSPFICIATTTKTTILRPLYRSTCISRHFQLRTGGFCWCKVLLPACPCWQQPVHLD